MTKPKRPKAKCLDPAWKYVPAIETDVGKRFHAIWREQRKEAEHQRATVTTLKRVAK